MKVDRGKTGGEHCNEGKAQSERLTKMKDVLKSLCGGLNEAYRFGYLILI